MCLTGYGVSAADYPERAIRVVVPTTAGGGADTIARTLAARLTERLGWSVVVENRPGANGVIGVDQVAKAAPDGHTLLLTFADHFVNPSLYKALPFDMARDFAPVNFLGALPFVLVVTPSLPAQSVQGLIELARARPGKLNFASVGTGGMVHMAAELFKLGAGVAMTHVPYKGSSAALPDVINDRVQLMFTSAISAKPFVDAGHLRVLGISSPERSPTMPDLPTIAESGVPGYQVEIWYGVLAPARTPSAVVARLNAEIGSVISANDFKSTLARQGVVVAPPGTPEQFRAFYTAEMGKWARVVRETRIEVN